ncbi:MAG: hypothetical protein ACE361_21895 [Aureliella sp.]
MECGEAELYLSDPDDALPNLSAGEKSSARCATPSLCDALYKAAYSRELVFRDLAFAAIGQAIRLAANEFAGI